MALQIRTAGRRRRGISALFGAVATGLGIFGAVAFACTGGVKEYTYLTTYSGTHGASLTVQSWTGASALAHSTPGFYFRYAYPGDPTVCHHETPIGASVTSTATGDIGSSLSKYTRTIPNLGGSAGQTGQACWSTGNMVDNEIAQPANITLN